MKEIICNDQIDELEARILKVYEEIGKHFYEENKDKTFTDTVYTECFAKIAQVNKEKEYLEIKELLKQGLRKCANCESHITIDSIYCNKCGIKLEPLPEELLEQPEAEVEEVTVPKCVACGFELETDDVFCPNCGKKQS